MRMGYCVGSQVEVQLERQGSKQWVRGIIVEIGLEGGIAMGTIIVKTPPGMEPAMKVGADKEQIGLTAVRGVLDKCRAFRGPTHLPEAAVLLRAYYGEDRTLKDGFVTASEQDDQVEQLATENAMLKRELEKLKGSHVTFQKGGSSASTGRSRVIASNSGAVLDDGLDVSEDETEGDDDEDPLVNLTKAAGKLWQTQSRPSSQAGSSRKEVAAPDVNQLVLLETLKVLKSMQKKGRQDSDDDGSEGDDDVTSGRTRGIRRALQAYRLMRQRVQKQPKKVVKEWLADVRKELGASESQAINLRDFPKKIPFGQLVHMKRVFEILLGVWDEAETGSIDRVKAQLAQSMRCIHQVALDQGNWRQGWPLLGLQDPCQRRAFGGTEEQMEIVNDLLKVQDDLDKRMAPHRADKDNTKTDG